MRALIEDACFTAGAKIRIDRGDDELSFYRCSFEGCDIFVADPIERAIFRQCVFRGATFSGQPFSPRIASDCHCGCAETEMAASAAATRDVRFRR
jgi:uncharacterized protein YjbI with pentapeptide repeats